MIKWWNTGAAQRRGLPGVALVADAIHSHHSGDREFYYYELIDQLDARVELRVYTTSQSHGPRIFHAETAMVHAATRHHPSYTGGRRFIRH